MPLGTVPQILRPPKSQPRVAQDIWLWPRVFQGWWEDGRLVLCLHPSMKVTSEDKCELHWVEVLLPWAILQHYPCRLCTCHCMEKPHQAKTHPGVGNYTKLLVLTQPKGRPGDAWRGRSQHHAGAQQIQTTALWGAQWILHCWGGLIFSQKSVWFGETGEYSVTALWKQDELPHGYSSSIKEKGGLKGPSSNAW